MCALRIELRKYVTFAKYVYTPYARASTNVANAFWPTPPLYIFAPCKFCTFEEMAQGKILFMA